MPQRPDPATRLLSHVLVAGVAGFVIGRRSGTIGGVLAAAAAAVAHEELDAPVAQALTDLGL
jgi:hypothetical protein